MTTVIAFIVTLGILIVVHEFGHYQVARWCGVKVLKFSVGFGKTLWRHQRSPADTEFAVGLLPLGGYVKMLDEREGPVDASEVSQAFNRQSLWKRTAIVSAGPAANLLLAVVLYGAAHGLGVDEPKAVLSAPVAGSLAERADLRSGDWVRAVSIDGVSWDDVASLPTLHWQLMQAALQKQSMQWRVSARDGTAMRVVTLDLGRLTSNDVGPQTLRDIGLGPAFSPPTMGRVSPGGAADLAGLREGDRVLQVNGEAVVDATTLRQRIRAQPGQTMTWRVTRQGEPLTLAVRPKAVADANARGDAKASAATVGRIDAAVGGAPEMVTVRHGLVDALWLGAVRTWEVSAMTVRMIGRMLVGEASIKNLSGPLTIADVAGQSAQRGASYFLGFLALVSVSLGVLNLLPLPMLDGGHLMYYLFEAVSGRPVSDVWLQRLQRGGAVLLLLMMTVALSNDLTRLFGH